MLTADFTMDSGYEKAEILLKNYTHLCKVTSSSLTSIHFHYKTAGEEAAHMLLSLKKENIVPKTLTLDYEIVERESTKRL